MDADNDKTPPAEASKRSPSFPVVAIDEAIEKANVIYKADKRAFTTYAALLEHMGYKARDKKGGRSARMVSTLKQYNLLEERGDQYRISDAAFRILETPDGTPERAAMVRDAAMQPPIVRKVLAHFQGQLPSDTTLRSYLIFTEGFNPDSAKDFIRVLRRTITVANPAEGDYNAGEEPNDGANTPLVSGGSPMPPQPQLTPRSSNAGFNPPPAPPAPLAGQGKELRFNISRDSEASVVFRGPVTQEAIDKLAKMLELQKDTFPTTAELMASPESSEPSKPKELQFKSAKDGVPGYEDIDGRNLKPPKS